MDELDLRRSPYVSPLLLRSVCLLSAHLDGPAARNLAEYIAQSIQQCFAAYELLYLPTASSLQSILLLLVSPLFSQASIMTAPACRMALTLGLHRPQAPRPDMYCSCIIASRWQVLKSPAPQLSVSVSILKSHTQNWTLTSRPFSAQGTTCLPSKKRSS